ncbi:MAG: hypothetical protein HQK49_21300 [Oligoflexia bacterium]|nr:hypothetical protein [Oligoflexia bacterium]
MKHLKSHLHLLVITLVTFTLFVFSTSLSATQENKISSNVSSLFLAKSRDKLIHQTSLENLLAILKDWAIRPGKETKVWSRIEDSDAVFLESISTESFNDFSKMAKNDKIENPLLVFPASILDGRDDFHFTCNWNHFGKFDEWDSAHANELKKMSKLLNRVNKKEDDEGDYYNEIVIHNRLNLNQMETILLSAEIVNKLLINKKISNDQFKLFNR